MSTVHSSIFPIHCSMFKLMFTVQMLTIQMFKWLLFKCLLLKWLLFKCVLFKSSLMNWSMHYVQICCSMFGFIVQLQCSNPIFKFSVQVRCSLFHAQCSLVLTAGATSAGLMSIDLQCLIQCSNVSQCPLLGSRVHEVIPNDEEVYDLRHL